MKKIIAFLLILSCIVVLTSCGKNQEDDGKAMETAETYIGVTGNMGVIELDENVARTLLETYTKETLGLSKDIYEYELRISSTRLFDKDGCLVEAFLEGAEKPEGTFVILGQQCFVYNSKQKKYFLLTTEGQKAVSVDKENVSTTQSVTEIPFEQDVEQKNNEKLHGLFDGYTKEQLGLDKEITGYFLVATGTTTTAEDGSLVFVVRLRDENGEFINHTVAFNDDGNYMFDYEINKYKKLS